MQSFGRALPCLACAWPRRTGVEGRWAVIDPSGSRYTWGLVRHAEGVLLVRASADRPEVGEVVASSSKGRVTLTFERIPAEVVLALSLHVVRDDVLDPLLDACCVQQTEHARTLARSRLREALLPSLEDSDGKEDNDGA